MEDKSNEETFIKTIDKKIFSGDGRLRSGWRILIFLIVVFPPIYYLTFLLWEELLIRYFIIFWLLLFLSMLAATYLDRRPTGTIGFFLHSDWFKEYLQGIVLGVILVSLLFFLEITLGYIAVSFNKMTLSLMKNILIISLFTTLFQSAFEELFFRGYIFQNLIEATNTVIAILILSILFGLGHLLTPYSSKIVAINLSVFGIMHGVAYIKTKSLFLPSGLHFSWNFFMRNIYSLPVSGNESPSSLLNVKEMGPAIITGDKYGPEAGIPALVLMIVCTCIIWFSRRITIAPEMKDLWEKDL